jgi:hypothetical protein
MRWAFTFNTISGRTAIHKADCPEAKKTTRQNFGYVEAASPEAAARKVDREGDLSARGFPKPVVKKCCNDGPEVLKEILRFR